MFKNILLVAAMGLVLASCNDPVEIKKEEDAVTGKLPHGCRFEYYGYFNEMQMRVAAIVCDNKNVSNTITATGGKGPTYNLISTIED